MTIQPNTGGNSVCTCDHFAPDVWELTSTTFPSDLAKDLYIPGVSSTQMVYAAIGELLNKSSGTLYDLQDEPIDLFKVFADGDDLIAWAFGKDWGRGMRRLLDRIEHPHRNRMKATPKLLMRVLLLHYARQIRTCRTCGRCSTAAHAA